jgi:5-methyltetrahydrofolate--homocysteine methyltransferase
LPIDQYGIPSTAEKRLKLAIKLVNLVEKYHIDPEKLFIDFLVQHIALSPYNAQVSLDTIRMIKKHILSVKTFICLTAISFGLPERRLINRNFISLLINENIDSIILDPLDKDLIDNIYSIKMLLGKDENCMNYINYIRSR